MDCAGVAGHLVAYHVGLIASDDERDAVEAHLIACSACVKTYLALKRAADGELRERPGEEVRARLRANVARAFPPRDEAEAKKAKKEASAKRASVAVLARRIPLYQGVALAAIAAAVALAAPSMLQRVSRSDSAVGAPAIDSSRTRAASLGIY